MALPRYTNSRFARLFGGRNLIILLMVGIAFYMLNTYRQNAPLPASAVAPDFTLTTVDNQTFQLHDIRMPVVLVFYNQREWFSNNIYPTVYAREMPSLKFLQEDGMAQIIILIKGIDTPEKLREFQDKKDNFYLENISFVSHNQDIAKAYGVRSWPHVFILDRNHRVRYNAKILSADSIRKALGGV